MKATYPVLWSDEISSKHPFIMRKCKIHGVNFIIDSGASRSIVTDKFECNVTGQDNKLPTFQWLNDSCIVAKGYAKLTIDIGIRPHVEWVFCIVPGAQNCLIGADFLRHYSIIVDLARDQLSIRNDNSASSHIFYSEQKNVEGDETDMNIQTQGYEDEKVSMKEIYENLKSWR